MKLSFDKIKEITFGAVDIFEENGMLFFRKCTKKQIDAWHNVSDDLGTRAETTTGIVFDFHTDSRHLTFEVFGGKFELLINGLFTEYMIASEEQHTLSCDLDGTMNRVRLVFPSHSKGTVQEITVDDDAQVIPHIFDEKILFIGDSITQGWNSTFNHLSYAEKASVLLNAESVIDGIGGAIFCPSAFDVSDFDPDRIVVAFGTNDFSCYDKMEDFEKVVSAYYQLVSDAYPGKKLYAILPIRRHDFTAGKIGTVDEFRNVIKNAGKSYGFTVVDGYSLMPDFPEYYYDDIHPNALGFSAYAENLVQILREDA